MKIGPLVVFSENESRICLGVNHKNCLNSIRKYLTVLNHLFPFLSDRGLFLFNIFPDEVENIRFETLEYVRVDKV